MKAVEDTLALSGADMGNIKNFLQQKDEKNLLINIFIAFLIKGASLFITTFSMPLYIKYFDNNEMLGIWYTILSLLSWIMICDLGLGNGLRNRLTAALALHDTAAAQKYISSTYAVLSAIMIPIILLGSFLLQFVDLKTFFNVSAAPISNKVLQQSIQILLCGIGISFVLKIINVVAYAIQKPFINNALALATSALPLIYVFLYKGENLEQNLLRLSIVHVLAINLPLLITTIVLFKKTALKKCTPSLRNCDLRTAKQMLGFGMQFFAAQVFFMLLMSTNEIILTKYFSAETVISYSIYYKLFTAVGSLFMLALTPLWSKVTKDLAERRFQTIQRTNHILYLIAGLAILAEFALIPFLQWVINLWLGANAIEVDYITAFILAAFGGIYILNIVLTTVANGIGELKTQIVFYGIGAILKLPAILFLQTYFPHWNIVVVFNSLILLTFCVFQLLWVERKIKILVKQEAK